MIDFEFNEPTLNGTLLYIIVFILVVVFGYRKGTSPQMSFNPVEIWLLFLVLLSLSIGNVVTGDFYTYQTMVKQYDFTIGAHNHAEAIYATIIRFCNSNYLLFRTIVFGLACFITLWVFRRFGIKLYVALFFLFATNIRLYGYSRAILAAAIFFLGLSFICKPEKWRILSYLVGSGFILLSYQFHHSSIILIALFPFAFLHVDKKVALILLLLIPLFSILLKGLFNDILLNSLLDDYDDLQEKIIIYSEGRTLTYSIWGKIRGFLGGCLFYYEVYLIIRSCVFNNKGVDKSIQRLFSFVLVAVITAISVYLIDTSVKIFYSRITRFLMIPMTILVVYLRQEQLIKDREFKILIIVGALLQLWDFENSIKSLI